MKQKYVKQSLDKNVHASIQEYINKIEEKLRKAKLKKHGREKNGHYAFGKITAEVKDSVRIHSIVNLKALQTIKHALRNENIEEITDDFLVVYFPTELKQKIARRNNNPHRQKNQLVELSTQIARFMISEGNKLKKTALQAKKRKPISKGTCFVVVNEKQSVDFIKMGTRKGWIKLMKLSQS